MLIMIGINNYNNDKYKQKIYQSAREESKVSRSSAETTNSCITLLKVKYLVREDEKGQGIPIFKVQNIPMKIGKYLFGTQA